MYTVEFEHDTFEIVVLDDKGIEDLIEPMKDAIEKESSWKTKSARRRLSKGGSKGGGNSGGGIQSDNNQSSPNPPEDASQVSNDMDDEIPF